ncbi:S-adenosyl-L-methionine-dependent methyltransferase [Amylostereum chailletii]|nr:S-adenosyl-L-methionine-dependent methyltransferase [Amylostereum chailletii]
MPPLRARRPTAFEVTDGIDPSDSDAGPSNPLAKRRSEEQLHEDRIRNADIDEDKNPVVLGEDEDEDERRLVRALDGAEGADTLKPVRIINDFSIFDPNKSNRLVSLDELKEVLKEGRTLEGAAYVTAVFENDEDAGLEGEYEVDWKPVRMRLRGVRRVWTNYAVRKGPVMIETTHAHYILGQPSDKYKEKYKACILKHLIVQALLSMAADATWTYTPREFVDYVSGRITRPLTGSSYCDADREDMLPLLEEVFNTTKDPKILGVRQSDLVRAAQRFVNPAMEKGKRINTAYTTFDLSTVVGNLDLAVLHPKNQNQTTVTEPIAIMADGWFSRGLRIIGAPRGMKSPKELAFAREGIHEHLVRCIENAHKDARKVRTFQEIKKREPWMKFARVDDDVYAVGDVAVIAKDGVDLKTTVLPAVEQVPEDARLEDYFWFAKIMRIDRTNNQAHVQWLEHASDTVLHEFSDPRELYSRVLCDNIHLGYFCGKAKVVDLLKDANVFEALPDDAQYFHRIISRLRMDDDVQRTKAGYTCRGITYHVNDTVLIAAPPAENMTDVDRFLFSARGLNMIARILSFTGVEKGIRRKDDPLTMRVKLFGRVDELLPEVRQHMPEDEETDTPDEFPEHHLFVTEQEAELPVRLTLRRCQIKTKADAIDSHGSLADWVCDSPDNFYVRTAFRTRRQDQLNPRDVDRLRALTRDLKVCTRCEKDRDDEAERREKFEEEEKPLRVLDLFAGVGAFGIGMEAGSQGWMKTTHAVEVSPSAARTLKLNASDTTVYNQCANVVLRYAVRTLENRLDEETSGHDDEVLPPPPKPGDIDCIVAGFPCQPHSTLNMFQNVNDSKSYLLLNLLSWVDFLKPRFCFFENVDGILQWNLNGVQRDKHKVDGGVEMGGVRFLIWAMTMLGYQVRVCLLQAAHYGAPQTRVRFFMFASKLGSPLMMAPRPTHYLPEYTKNMELTVPFPDPDDPGKKIRVSPVADPTEPGRASFRFVTVEDAIGDLPRFDWLDPKRAHARNVDPPDPDLLELRGPDAVERVKHDMDHRDPDDPPYIGSRTQTEYFCEPLTSFQARARMGREEGKDLQHVTRVQKPDIVQRVCHIPLKKGADYRTLAAEMREWQYADPTSAIARGGYKAGLYGRIDKDSVFQTTTTNIEPTAKQSKCLHPWMQCKRVVTVRELARSQGFPDWFTFHAYDGRVKTLHRQIGNAVAWPVGEALGREIRAIVYWKWRREQGSEHEINR